MSIAKRVTYLKGLTEGLSLGNDTKEEKILRVIIEVLGDMAAEIEELQEDVKSLDEDMSALVEDVEELAEEMEELADEMEELIEDVEELEDALDEVEISGDCCCESNDHSHTPPVVPTPVVAAPPSGRANGRTGRQNKAAKQPQFFEVECPSCQNEITIDEDVLGLGVIDCPNCGERMELEE